MDSNENKTPTVKQDAGLTGSERALISNWKEKIKESGLSFYFEVKEEVRGKDRHYRPKPIMKKKEGVDLGTQEDLLKAELYKITGVRDMAVAKDIIMEASKCLLCEPINSDSVERSIYSVLNLIKELEPKDPFEGMLASRMIALHYMGMGELAKANLSESMDASNQHTSRATKLLRLWNEAKDRWDKHRKKEDQKVVVEHVHVNEGGQAIVGNVSHQGGFPKNKGGNP